jgi:hypothetical protein
MAGVLGPGCQPRLLGAQSSGAAACTGETKPAGSRSPGACLLVLTARNHSSCSWLGGTKSEGHGSSGAWLLHGFRKRSPVALLSAWGKQACWPAPFVTLGAAGTMGPAYTGMQESLVFQGEGNRLCSRGGAWSSKFLSVLRSRTYCQACWEMEPGATRRLQGWGIGSVEPWVVLPILPVVGCFSICRFGEGFVSC